MSLLYKVIYLLLYKEKQISLTKLLKMTPSIKKKKSNKKPYKVEQIKFIALFSL